MFGFKALFKISKGILSHSPEEYRKVAIITLLLAFACRRIFETYMPGSYVPLQRTERCMISSRMKLFEVKSVCHIRNDAKTYIIYRCSYYNM